MILDGISEIAQNRCANNRNNWNVTSVSSSLWRTLLTLTQLPLDKMAAILADDIFRCIFMNEKFCILIEISLKFVPKGPINNNPALVQLMAWRQIGNKPLFEPILTRFTDAYICGTRGRWVNTLRPGQNDKLQAFSNGVFSRQVFVFWFCSWRFNWLWI